MEERTMDKLKHISHTEKEIPPAQKRRSRKDSGKFQDQIQVILSKNSEPVGGEF